MCSCSFVARRSGVLRLPVKLRQSPRRFYIPFFVCKAMLRDRVVASGAKGIAPKHAPYRKRQPYKKAAFLKRLKGVG